MYFLLLSILVFSAMLEPKAHHLVKEVLQTDLYKYSSNYIAGTEILQLLMLMMCQ